MKRFNIVIICQILALISFLSAHYILAIYHINPSYFYWFFTDFYLFTAIILQLVSILLLISLEVSYQRIKIKTKKM